MQTIPLFNLNDSVLTCYFKGLAIFLKYLFIGDHNVITHHEVDCVVWREEDILKQDLQHLEYQQKAFHWLPPLPEVWQCNPELLDEMPLSTRQHLKNVHTTLQVCIIQQWTNSYKTDGCSTAVLLTLET